MIPSVDGLWILLRKIILFRKLATFKDWYRQCITSLERRLLLKASVFGGGFMD